MFSVLLDSKEDYRLRHVVKKTNFQSNEEMSNQPRHQHACEGSEGTLLTCFIQQISCHNDL